MPRTFSTLTQAITPCLTPDGQITWGTHPSMQEVEAQFGGEVALAGIALQRYVADLKRRFRDGGMIESARLPTGETFMDIVSGHPFGGLMLCHCLSPLLAVQLFQDAVERHVIKGRATGTLYWKTMPALEAIQEESSREDGDTPHPIVRRLTLYVVYARLLML